MVPIDFGVKGAFLWEHLEATNADRVHSGQHFSGEFLVGSPGSLCTCNNLWGWEFEHFFAIASEEFFDHLQRSVLLDVLKNWAMR
nr:hypothetical protein Iba_chr10dCG9270 [Ipomoea batatas]GME18723.1 hypothetical protein Iba_scaffold21124CG0010 [Ipomoea batatas]